MRAKWNDTRHRLSIGIMYIIVATMFLPAAGLFGCDIIKEKPAVFSDVEKKLQKEVPRSSSQDTSVTYTTIEESGMLRIIAVDSHADLKALGRQLANEAKDRPLFEVRVYDDVNEAKNYRVLTDPNIKSDDAAYEDNWDHLVAVYRKNKNSGDNYVEIYNDISHEDVEIVKF